MIRASVLRLSKGTTDQLWDFRDPTDKQIRANGGQRCQIGCARGEAAREDLDYVSNPLLSNRVNKMSLKPSLVMSG